ncbi:hypothetical protein UPYG_G00145760 [Umbra pygmaea]|uniref:Ig-like domain-containing protein n=1 Tax=Umbra pygmaea TaxID=75934 RepID=A0ABD0X0G5_UMBPY
MKTSWIVYALCIYSVSGDIIFKRTGQPDTVKMECGEKTSNMDVEWTFTAVGTSQSLLILDINGRSGKIRKGNAPMVERAKLRDSTLEISSVCSSDAGQYICKVNRVEKQRHSLYIVEVSVTPDSVLNKGTVATLQCHLSGVGPLPKVTWLSPVGKLVDSGTVSLSPADVTDSGEWKCQITQGEGTHSEALIIQVATHCKNCISGVQTPVKPWSMLGLGLWVWVGVGAGSLVLIILLVATVSLHCRNKRMRKRRKKMNIRQPTKSTEYCKCKSILEGPPQRRPRQKPPPLFLQQR